MKKLLFSLIALVISLSLPLSADQISGFNYATDPDAQADWAVVFSTPESTPEASPPPPPIKRKAHLR